MNSPPARFRSPRLGSSSAVRRPSASSNPPCAISHAAFTLIELLVVVSIIALLVGVMLPSFNNMRIEAKNLDTASFLNALEQGNEQFKAERTIGGQYVPSHSDSENDPKIGNKYGQIADPLDPAPSTTAKQFSPISGASLFVYGLAGADTLGTPGFRDLDVAPGIAGSNLWYDDFGNTGARRAPHLHFLDPTTLEPLQPRYGPFVDDKVRNDRIETINRLGQDGIIAAMVNPFGSGTQQIAQKVFVDTFRQPILYYRARRGATVMITNPTAGGTLPTPGVFDHRDNETLTGSANFPGVNLGGGAGHQIGLTKYPVISPTTANLSAATFNGTFERFIWDRNVTQRNSPVNRETFLLISAGYDGLYGTTDDITNWNRDQ